jgi:hypothetical protein
MYKVYVSLVFLALVAALCFGVYYYHEKSESYCSLYKNALANNNVLIKRMEKVYADTLEVSERNRKLEEEAKKDKGYFDWYVDISNTSVIRRLRED